MEIVQLDSWLKRVAFTALVVGAASGIGTFAATQDFYFTLDVSISIGIMTSTVMEVFHHVETAFNKKNASLATKTVAVLGSACLLSAATFFADKVSKGET